MNVEAMTHHAPNALAAAQDTGQSQEIVREGIRVVQTVQASENVKEMQRVHRKTENDEREGQGRNGRDEYQPHANADTKPNTPDEGPVIRENARTKKRISFIA